MGLIEKLLVLVFGGGRNAVVETAQVFRENAEAGAQRAYQSQEQALAQLAAEFAGARKGWFDSAMDGINRIPRPALALGTLGLFLAAMVDPIWFAARMQGIALVPEPLWWLLGVIVSFYFGARHQSKSQDFQRDLAATMARAPQVMANLEHLRGFEAQPEPVPDAAVMAQTTVPEDNPALEAWRQARQG